MLVHGIKMYSDAVHEPNNYPVNGEEPEGMPPPTLVDRFLQRPVIHARDLYLGETTLTLHDYPAIAKLPQSGIRTFRYKSRFSKIPTFDDPTLCHIPYADIDANRVVAWGAVGTGDHNCGDCLRVCGPMGCETLLVIDGHDRSPAHLDISFGSAAKVTGSNAGLWHGIGVTKVDKAQCRDIWRSGRQYDGYKPEDYVGPQNKTGGREQDGAPLKNPSHGQDAHGKNVTWATPPARRALLPYFVAALAPAEDRDNTREDDMSSSASRNQACGLALVMAVAAVIMLL